MSNTRAAKTVTATAVAAALLASCGGSTKLQAPTSMQLAASCSTFASSLFAGTNSTLTTVLNAATATTPEHCQVDGRINPRIGADNQQYAIKFRLRLPTTNWNGRFYMGGGSGTNGNLVDPVAQVANGYATIGTDGGHDNATNSVAAAGGQYAFGVDNQARVDYAYNAYDQVTQAGKALVQRFYAKAPDHSYYVGCSEGGREGMLMSQRFPTYYDGIISGAPVLHLPLGPMTGIYTTQLFAKLAQRSSLALSNGEPAIAKTYSDPDLLLIRNAVLSACDKLDDLADGSVDNIPMCTPAVVAPKLAALQCLGAKTDQCLTADQIATMQTAYAGPVDSSGKQLYSDWQWDAGISGQDGTAYNQKWRDGWLGSFGAATNTASKLASTPVIPVAYSTPLTRIAVADSLQYSLNYNFDTEPAKLYATSAAYPQSTAAMTFTDATDLNTFKARGGKLMVYHGVSDATVSVLDTLRWYEAMNRKMGGNAQDFARAWVVPGMGHCSGGPATDKFDMLPQLVDWVEKGIAPDRVVATATSPGYFNAAARSRPLCPYPKQSRYNGSGDINAAANFTCQ